MALNKKKTFSVPTSVVICAILFLVIAMSWNVTKRENLRFNNYTDNIFPDKRAYTTQYWPRVGQLGECPFSGYPAYPTAY